MISLTVGIGGYLLSALLSGFLLGILVAFLFWRKEKKDLLNRALYGRDYLYYQSEQEAGKLSPASNIDEIKEAVSKRLKKMGLDADQNHIDAIAKQKQDMIKAGRLDLL